MATTFPIGADTSKAVNDINKLIAEIRKAGKEAGMTEDAIDKMVESTKKASSEGVSNVNNVTKSLGGLETKLRDVGAGFAAVLAAAQLKDIAMHVIDVTSQFQRLEAILTNTLGSSSAAQRALADIQRLAAKTPFSVIELTENFIKLANRGVKPTMDQMTRLGDVAATLGKPFEQVVEAILDINNPERWKEIGLRAETAGNKMKLSFRDTTVEVDRTVQGVTNAVAQIGELEGVSGSMEAISGTLGGKISNLGDTLDRLSNIIGQKAAPYLGELIDYFNNLGSSITSNDLSAWEKILLLLTPQAVGQMNAVLSKVDELRAKQKESAISNTVNAAMSSGNVEAYIKALDQNIYKEEIVERIKAEQLKNEKKKHEFTREELKIQEDVQERQAQYARFSEQEIEKDAKSRAEKLKWLEDFKASLEDLRNRFGKGATQFDENAIQGMVNAGAPDKEQGVTDEDINAAKEDAEKIHQANMRAIKQETFNFVMDGLQAMSQMQYQQYQQDLNDLQAQANYEMALAGNNADAKAKIQKDFAAKQKQLQIEQAQRSRDLAILEIVLNTARGVTAALASIPPNVPLSIFVGLSGLAQLAVANATKMPKFKDGVFQLDGPGTETSDSIVAGLSRNESVVSAEKSRRFKDILKPMIEEDLTLLDVKNIIDSKLPDKVNPTVIVHGNGNNRELIEKLDSVEKAIKSKRETHLTFDEEGFSYKVLENGTWVRYLKNRYNM